jgi:hypothetical protein
MKQVIRYSKEDETRFHPGDEENEPEEELINVWHRYAMGDKAVLIYSDAEGDWSAIDYDNVGWHSDDWQIVSSNGLEKKSCIMFIFKNRS